MDVCGLYGELAASLVRATTDKWLPGSARASAGAVLDDMCQSTFEDACAMLRKLGVAHREAGTSRVKLLIDQDRVAQFVADRSRIRDISMPSIDEVFAVWIWCVDLYGFVSAQRTPFVPHDDIGPVMMKLVALDYAKSLGAALIWTEKIGPAMRMSGKWNENNISHQEIDERDVDLEMRKAVASIPADVRQAALRGDVIAVTKALCQRWGDGVWFSDGTDDAPWYALAARAELANRLIELVQDDAVPRDVN